MGFQLSDIETLAHDLSADQIVTGVWVQRASDERSATLYASVDGFDDEGYENRLRVRRQVEGFIANRLADMRFSGFVFDYHVFIDDEELGIPQIPEGAVTVYERPSTVPG